MTNCVFARSTATQRQTLESSISAQLVLDGKGDSSINTGIGFYDHMLEAFAKHAKFDLQLTCIGDLHVDDHHTVEDCALVIGQAINEALGERKGIARFGTAYAPLDEALCRVVVDLSGRSFAVVDLGLKRERLGDLSTETLPHFFQSLSQAARCAIHVDVIRGENDHHRAEAAFKATALALRQAVSRDDSNTIPSTKGVL